MASVAFFLAPPPAQLAYLQWHTIVQCFCTLGKLASMECCCGHGSPSYVKQVSAHQQKNICMQRRMLIVSIQASNLLWWWPNIITHHVLDA
jgi:hypothetical protein